MLLSTAFYQILETAEKEHRLPQLYHKKTEFESCSFKQRGKYKGRGGFFKTNAKML